jgi:hypothetical protein
MSRMLLGIIAVAVAAATPLSSALAKRSKDSTVASKGDLVVTFSGSGGGSYRYHEPAIGGTGAGCSVADTTYTEVDSYRWRYRFVMPPGGGSSATPWSVSGGGQLSGSEQRLQCGGTAAVTSSCTQTLHVPLTSNSADLAYPGVIVGASGRLVTVGAIGELLPAAVPPVCSGVGPLIPNPVAGFSQLQASVSLPRSELDATGDVTRHFTMAGAGLYNGVALSGSCNSASCDVNNCSTAGGAGAPNTCSFNESYTGTIEVRVVR